MAQDSWPSPTHNARAVTDAEYEQVAALFSGDGVWGDPRDAQVVSAGTGLQVTIRANVWASVRGQVWTSGTSALTFDIAPNAGTTTRWDRVVLRLDRSTWTVRAVVKQGVAGAGTPSVTRDSGTTGVWEVSLATLSITAGATSVGLLRAEQYVGSRVRPCTGTSLPLSPALGELAYEFDTGELIMFNGTIWVTVYSYSGIVNCNASLSAWDVATDSVLEEKNGTVSLRMGSFTRAAGALPGATTSRLPCQIPARYRHATRDQYVTGYVTGLQVCRITIYSAATDTPGQVWLTQHPSIDKDDSVLTSGISWVVN